MLPELDKLGSLAAVRNWSNLAVGDVHRLDEQGGVVNSYEAIR